MGIARLVRIVHDLLPRLSTPSTSRHGGLGNLVTNTAPPRLLHSRHSSSDASKESSILTVVGRKGLMDLGQGRKVQRKSTCAM